MGQTSAAQSIEEIIAPVLNSEDLELVDVQYQKEGKGWCLRIFIDKEGGITVEDCQKVILQFLAENGIIQMQLITASPTRNQTISAETSLSTPD